MNLAARLANLAGPGETIASASAHEQPAAALASLANPGETISSAAARDELTHGVDALCEDLGDCILKHFDKPVQAYRIGPASPQPGRIRRHRFGTAMEPTIAVIPFRARTNAPEHLDVGNLIADSVIWRLSKSTKPEGDFTSFNDHIPRLRKQLRGSVSLSRYQLYRQRRVCRGRRADIGNRRTILRA